MSKLTDEEAKTLKAAKDVLNMPLASINGKFLRNLVDTIERLDRLSEADAKPPSQGGEPLPCPFCGGAVDPKGWLGGDGKRGPECARCGATAQTIEAWNAREYSPSPAAVQERLAEWFNAADLVNATSAELAEFLILSFPSITGPAVRLATEREALNAFRDAFVNDKVLKPDIDPLARAIMRKIFCEYTDALLSSGLVGKPMPTRDEIARVLGAFTVADYKDHDDLWAEDWAAVQNMKYPPTWVLMTDAILSFMAGK